MVIFKHFCSYILDCLLALITNWLLFVIFIRISVIKNSIVIWHLWTTNILRLPPDIPAFCAYAQPYAPRNFYKLLLHTNSGIWFAFVSQTLDIKPALFIFQCTCSLATACLFYHIVFSLSRLFLKFFEKVFNFFSTPNTSLPVFFSPLNWRLDYYTLYYPFCQHFFSFFLKFFSLYYILWIISYYIHYLRRLQ